MSENETFAHIVEDCRRQNEALKRRVSFLEWRLEQRNEETTKDFHAMQPFFESMKAKILLIFHDLPLSMGLSHQEIQDQFAKLYPMIDITNVPRRVRELVNEGKLWTFPDDHNVARFYLCLKLEAKVVTQNEFEQQEDNLQEVTDQ